MSNLKRHEWTGRRPDCSLCAQLRRLRVRRLALATTRRTIGDEDGYTGESSPNRAYDPLAIGQRREPYSLS